MSTATENHPGTLALSDNDANALRNAAYTPLVQLFNGGEGWDQPMNEPEDAEVIEGVRADTAKALLLVILLEEARARTLAPSPLVRGVLEAEIADVTADRARHRMPGDIAGCERQLTNLRRLLGRLSEAGA